MSDAAQATEFAARSCLIHPRQKKVTVDWIAWLHVQPELASTYRMMPPAGMMLMRQPGRIPVKFSKVPPSAASRITV